MEKHTRLEKKTFIPYLRDIIRKEKNSQVLSSAITKFKYIKDDSYLLNQFFFRY